MSIAGKIFGYSILALGGMVLIGSLLPAEPPKPPQETVLQKLARERQAVLDGIFLQEIRLQNRRGTIMASMNIRSTAERRIKDIVVTCRFFAPSGTQIANRSFTVFEAFQSGTTKAVSERAIGTPPDQAERYQCEPVDFAFMD